MQARRYREDARCSVAPIQPLVVALPLLLLACSFVVVFGAQLANSAYRAPLHSAVPGTLMTSVPAFALQPATITVNNCVTSDWAGDSGAQPTNAGEGATAQPAEEHWVL